VRNKAGLKSEIKSGNRLYQKFLTRNFLSESFCIKDSPSDKKPEEQFIFEMEDSARLKILKREGIAGPFMDLISIIFSRWRWAEETSFQT
jgi:hypothetical protein